MFFHDLDKLLKYKIPNLKIKDRVEKNGNEVDLVIEEKKEVKMLKIFNIGSMKKNKTLKFIDNFNLLCDFSLPFLLPSLIQQISDNMMIYERNCYERDLEEVIQIETFSICDVYRVINSLFDILMIWSECDVVISNLKSSNVVFDMNNNIKLCDLCLNALRKVEDIRIYDMCFKSPEELNGYECNERSVIWSIGCILSEIINKKLPFNEDDNMIKTMNNIMRCKYSFKRKSNKKMKEMIERMLKVKSKDRLSLKELKNDMSEILRDEEYLMMCNERKETTLPCEYSNSTKLRFDDIHILIQLQSFFGSLFSQLSNLAFHFVEPIVKFIQFMKVNPIGPKGFKLLLPYLCLLINKNNELNLRGMRLNDESMMLLSEELYKYPNLEKIDITQNNNIHSKGLKGLFLKFPISKIKFNFNESKELLIDKDIPELVKYIQFFNLSDLDIDDDIFKSFISLRLNELKEIEKLDLCNNKLTYKSIEIFINNLSSFPKLDHLELYGNEIGDKGMKLLSPHLHLLLDNYYYGINC